MKIQTKIGAAFLSGWLVIASSNQAHADAGVAEETALKLHEENTPPPNIETAPEAEGSGEPGLEAGVKATLKEGVKKVVTKGAGNNPVGIFFKTLLAPKEAH